MINLIWLALFVIAFAMAGASGRIDETSSALFASAEKTVMFCLGLVGILAFWSGLMRVADESGLTQVLARFFQPLLQRLFPSLKKNPKALGAVALSLAANILGLSNAATPLGIRAIQELQKSNPHPEKISPTIGTYLALIMGGFTLIPSTVIAFRAQAGSLQPADVLGPILIATLVGTTTAIILNGVLSKRRGK